MNAAGSGPKWTIYAALILTNISSILQHKKETEAAADPKKQRTLIHNGPRGFSARTFVLDKGFSQTQIVNAESCPGLQGPN